MNLIRNQLTSSLGEKVKTSQYKKSPVLTSVSHWQILVDKGNHLKFPVKIKPDTAPSGHVYLFGKDNVINHVRVKSRLGRKYGPSPRKKTW